jgi:hypothetical protein
VSHAARAPRKGPPEAAPDIALVTGGAKPAPGEKTAEKTAEKPVAKPEARQEDGASTPVVTLEDPWRYLHPSRVWPD